MKDRKFVLSILGFILLITGLVVGTILVQKRQILRKEAAEGENASITLPSFPIVVNPDVNPQFTLPIFVDTDSAPISAVDIVLSFTNQISLDDIEPNAQSTTSLKTFAPVNPADGSIDKTAIKTKANNEGVIDFGAVTFNCPDWSVPDCPGAAPTAAFVSQPGGTLLATLTFSVKPGVTSGEVLIAVDPLLPGPPNGTTDSNLVHAETGADILANSNLAFITISTAQNTFILPQVSAAPGTNGSFPINLDNESVIDLVGLAFTYDPAIDLNITDVTTTSRTAEFQPVSDFSIPGQVNVLLVDFTEPYSSIAPGSGAILDIHYTAPAAGETPLSVLLGPTEDPLTFLFGAEGFLPFTWQDGSFTVTTVTPTPTGTVITPSPTPTLTPTPTSTPTPTVTPVLTPTPSPTPGPDTGNLSFRIGFQGLPADDSPPSQPSSLDVIAVFKQGGSEVYRNDSLTITNNGNGIFSGMIADVAPGAYDIFFKGPAHLNKNYGQVIFEAGQTTTVDWSANPQVVGDVTDDSLTGPGDNRINLSDYSLAVFHFGSHIPSEGSRADLDFDGDVDLYDYSFIVWNFNKSGD